MTSIRQHIAIITKLLAKAGADSPGLCARVLAAHVANLDEIAFLLAQNESLDRGSLDRLYFLAGRLVGGEPLARVLGSREFYGRDFLVGRDALVPRPETELLIDLALERCSRQGATFADLGCGSGCIGLTLALERPGWRGVLLDISGPALKIAAANRERLGARCALLAGDMFNLPFLQNSLDLLLANPPYIAPGEEVMACVRDFDPPIALYSPPDGLAHLAAVSRQACRVLRPGGLVLLEHGSGQGNAVDSLLRASGFAEIEGVNDLAGLPRCRIARKSCMVREI